MRVPPLYNGKIWIGNNYQPALPNLMTRNAEVLQYALLCNKRPTVLQYISRMIGL